MDGVEAVELLINEHILTSIQFEHAEQIVAKNFLPCQQQALLYIYACKVLGSNKIVDLFSKLLLH